MVYWEFHIWLVVQRFTVKLSVVLLFLHLVGVYGGRGWKFSYFPNDSVAW